MLFNFVFEGNLSEDPELRFTPSGRAACRLRVAHNTRRRNADGEWKNGPTMWVTVTAWEALAERIAETLRKGDTIVVEARDDLSVWAYINRVSEEAAGQLQCTAANVSLSMRFNPAKSERPGKLAVVEQEQFEDPWAEPINTGERELANAA
jgi:single-strand DNA-binding protein